MLKFFVIFFLSIIQRESSAEDSFNFACVTGTDKPCKSLSDVADWGKNNLRYYNIVYLKPEGKDVVDIRGNMDGLPTIDGIVKHKGGDCKMLSAVFKTVLEKLNISSFYLFLKEVTKKSENEYSYTDMVHMVVIAKEKSNWIIFNNTEIVPTTDKPKVGDILDLKSTGIFKVDRVFSKYSGFFEYYQNNLCEFNCNSELYYQFLSKTKFKIKPSKYRPDELNL